MDKVKIAEFRNESSTRLSGTGTTYSDPPFRVEAFESEVIEGYAKNFGNADNTIKITVLWMTGDEGEFPFIHGTTPTSSTLKWIPDYSLVTYVSAGATAADQVNFRLVVPRIQAMFMMLQIDLSGTSAQADIEIYSLPRCQ